MSARVTPLSAILPVYNGAHTLRQAIDSALAQRFDGSLEVVVVNDGSTDSTPRILEDYGSKIKVVTQPNRGLSAARNAGAAAASGAYLGLLDADDFWMPDFAARMCTALDRNARAVLAFSDVIGMDENAQEVEVPPARSAPTLEDLLKRGWGICPSAVMFRHASFDACGGFNEDFRGLGFEDTYMWLRAREHGEFEYVPERLVTYRVPPYIVRAEKYLPGRKVFLRLLRERYGKQARGLIEAVDSGFAVGFAQKALHQMDSGDFRGALRTWMRVLQIKPSYFLEPNVASRLFRAQNLARLIGILSPSRSRA